MIETCSSDQRLVATSSFSLLFVNVKSDNDTINFSNYKYRNCCSAFTVSSYQFKVTLPPFVHKVQ